VMMAFMALGVVGITLNEPIHLSGLLAHDYQLVGDIKSPCPAGKTAKDNKVHKQ